MSVSKKKAVIFIAVIIILLVIILPVVAYFVANNNAKSNVADFTKIFKNICDIKYGNVSYNIINRHLIIQDIDISCSGEKIAYLKKAEFNHIVKNNPLPSNVQVDITNGTLYNNTDFFGIYGKAAVDNGYDKIDFDGRISYTLGSASKEFKLVTLDINAKDFGVIKGEMKVNNVYDKDIKNIFTNIKNNPASFYITFDDSGLKNKVLTKFSSISEISVDDVKTKTTNAIYKRALNADNFTKSNYNQLEKFIVNSNSVSLKLNEEDNVSISQTLEQLDFSGYRRLLDSFKNIKLEILAK